MPNTVLLGDKYTSPQIENEILTIMPNTVLRGEKNTSPQIENEILTIVANTVLRGVASSVRSAPFYSLMVDETTDSSCEEQVVICCRWIDDDLQAHEDFWCFVL